jgi:hypothetical protein
MTPLGRIYCVAEVAARLGIGRRKLQDLLADHPHYALNGNRKLFSEDDILSLWDAMRRPVRERHAEFFARTPIVVPVPTAGDPYASLRTKKRARVSPTRPRAT